MDARTILLSAAVLALLVSCVSPREQSRTPRTSIEQLLLMHAVQRSVANLNTPLPLPDGAGLTVDVTGLTRVAFLQDRSVSDDGSVYGPSTDLTYARDYVARRLGELGFRIETDPEQAKYLAKVVVHALGTEQGQTFFGMPQIQSVLVPFALPELTLYKAVRQKAHMRFSIILYDQRTGRLVGSTPFYLGNAYYNQYTILFFFSFRRTDLLAAP